MAFQYETHAWLLKDSFTFLEAGATIWVPTFIRSHLLLQICIEIANGRTTTSVCLKRWAKFAFFTCQGNESALDGYMYSAAMSF